MIILQRGVYYYIIIIMIYAQAKKKNGIGCNNIIITFSVVI